MRAIISVVEDNPSFQLALQSIIKETDHFEIGGIYSSAEEALQMLDNPPDMAIVDIQLPGINGIELIRQIKIANPAIECLICSMHDDDDKIIQALECGAVGYILKDSSVAQIQNALLEVKHGGAPMSPYIAKRVISTFRPKQKTNFLNLSERETEVLHLLSEGLQYKEIGERLFISYETVKKHLKNIYQKLHVQNKVEATIKYKQQ